MQSKTIYLISSCIICLFLTGSMVASSALSADATEIGLPSLPAIRLVDGNTLVPQGATWKYLDDGSDQGTAWTSLDFDDSAWASGPAQLGYGDGDEATVVGYGPDAEDKHITTYFRHTFTATAPSALRLRLLRDDGAVVHLNGTEVFRTNLPSGTIGHQTLASVCVWDEEGMFHEMVVSADHVVRGRNVIAVEIHQCDPGSSDLSFDLELSRREMLENFEMVVFMVGDVRLELMRPYSEDNPLGQFLAETGGGLHHVAYAVEGLDREMTESLHGRGLETQTAADGAHWRRSELIRPVGRQVG